MSLCVCNNGQHIHLHLKAILIMFHGQPCIRILPCPLLPDKLITREELLNICIHKVLCFRRKCTFKGKLRSFSIYIQKALCSKRSRGGEARPISLTSPGSAQPSASMLSRLPGLTRCNLFTQPQNLAPSSPLQVRATGHSFPGPVWRGAHPFLRMSLP